MKKTLVFGFALAFSITPLSAFAAVNSINGLTAADQSLVSPNSGATNTMHMDIVQVGADTHRFKWDGTPWRGDQGGTGWSNIAPGTLIYGNGSSPLATTTPANLGDILQFNGTFPTWVSTSSLGIVAQPAGSNGEIQFNSSGVFGASDSLKWNGSELIIGGNGIYTDDDATFVIGGPSLLVTGSTISILETNLFGFDVQASGDYGIQVLAPKATSVFSFLNPDNTLASAIIDVSRTTADRTYQFPDFSGTFGLLEADQKWTGSIFSKGTAATTTVNFGEIGDSTSHACFNTKNTDGQDISFYFVGTSMVVENNVCQ